ncbi:hypothetical protein QWZ08_11230 [Ferruginibacter paludis]|uniref:hypothetical protein n=1 Tax=Ferruginibacter paludis TaxID=1310417 RepID=UPI0025B35E23|nr:hypothetical protein [Ferruginibacter paludis]MDN3656203.1 hypothetical protein [Ferruginibacter paludis]
MPDKVVLSKSEWFQMYLFPAFWLSLLDILYKKASKAYLTDKETFIQICVCAMFAGILLFYNLFNISKIRKFVSVLSTLPKNKKIEIISNLNPTYTWFKFDSKTEDEYRFYCYGKFITIILDVAIIIDENGFYLNVMDAGRCFPMDFGYYQFMTKKIKKIIEENINEARFDIK